MNVRHQLRTVDLDALRSNVRLIRDSLPAGTRVLAVVKADAYGHGMAQVARAAMEAGAAHLAVATAEEGAALRDAGIREVPVLVLGAATPDSARLGVMAGLTMTVCNPAMVRWMQDAARACGRQGMVHLKLDTGMGRIGARTEDEVRDVLSALEASPDVRLTGAFTHFADADGDDLTFTREQLARFCRLTALLPAGILRHCANSAAIHVLPEAGMDMVRAGISMYGYPPVKTDMPLRPVMDWRAEVTYVKDIAPGDTVSYGRTYAADRPRRIATISCGYGDGYHRAASGRAQVLLHGRRAQVVGRICMDQMMVDVTEIPDAQLNDIVVLVGRDGDAQITVEEIAAQGDSFNYEFVCGINRRVPRVYTVGGQVVHSVVYLLDRNN